MVARGAFSGKRYNHQNCEGRGHEPEIAVIPERALGPVDTYRIHRMMAARVTTA